MTGTTLHVMRTPGTRSATLRRWALGVLIVVLATCGLADRASAHAEVVSTSPAAGSILSSAPDQIVLTFSEAVATVPNAIRLVAADGTEVELGASEQALGPDTISVALPDLDDGTFVVAWRAISADSHPVNGAFTFSVGDATTVATGLVGDLLAASGPATSTETLLGIGRGASFFGIAVLLGAVVVLGRGAPDVVDGRRTGRLLVVAGALAIVGTALMIGAQASLASGHASRWRSVTDTTAGRWWFVRLALLALAMVAVLLRKRWSASAVGRVVPAALGAALLAAVAAGGHGISGRWPLVGFTATVVHLAAMSLWVGGLVALALAVPRERLWTAATQFSPMAMGAVVVLIGTGIVNTWRQAGSWSALTSSHYGTWLLVKVVLVAGVVSIAAGSRTLVHRPRSDRGLGREAGPLVSTVGAAALSPTGDERALRRTVLAEVVGVLLVFAATSGLVSSPPPQEQATAPVSASVLQGDRVMQLIIDPPVTGGTVLHVYLSTLSGSLTENPTITVSASLPARSIGPLTIPVEATGPGHATSNAAVFPVAGTWTMTVSARYGEFDQAYFVTDVTIR